MVLLPCSLIPTSLTATIFCSTLTSGRLFSEEISAFISIFTSFGGSLVPTAIGSSIDFVGIAKIPVLICGLSILLFIFASLIKKSGKIENNL